MIKILHVISDKNIGGAGRLLLNLLSETDRERFDFTVVLPHGSMLTPRVVALGIKAIESQLSFCELTRIVKEEKPDIVHTHAAAKARIAAKLQGVETVNTRHCADDLSQRIPLRKKTAVRCFDTLFTDATIATADYVKDVLVDEGISLRKISVIINGSMPINELSREKKREVRLGLGLSESDFVIGIVARLERGKGHETFIEAAKLCQRKAPHMKFLIVGSGSLENELKAVSMELTNLRFLGFLENVNEIMNILDANVNCSYISETSSLSLSEGMSVGAIPIVSNCGGNGFMAAGCGIVFPKKDFRALANALIYLSRNPEEKNKLSLNAKQRFTKFFSAEKMARETENLYLNLLK